MKNFIRFFFLTFITLCATILAYPLVPIAVMLADEETGRLPKYLRWLETHDDLGWGAGRYEEPIGKAYEKYGKKVALIFWLWRNKAYTLRNKFRVKSTFQYFRINQKGSAIPPKFGPYFTYYNLKDLQTDKSWFDLYLGFAFGKFYLYSRMGWKLKPIYEGHIPKDNEATGMFIGIGVRSDDWDDFPVDKRPK